MAGKPITIVWDEDEAQAIWRDLHDLEAVVSDFPQKLEKLMLDIRKLPPSPPGELFTF